MSEDFEIWWHNEGSGRPPFKEGETCDHFKCVSVIAWSNGAFKATLSFEAEVARLKSEVKRLRKAGDEMAHKLENYGNYYLTSQWEDAKEGKQS